MENHQDPSGKTLKQLKAEKKIERSLALLFQKELRDLSKDNLLSVSKVDISPDLRHAKVYISFLLADKAQKSFQTVLEREKFIISRLYQAIRNDFAVMPTITFKLDLSQAINLEGDKISDSAS